MESLNEPVVDLDLQRRLDRQAAERDLVAQIGNAFQAALDKFWRDNPDIKSCQEEILLDTELNEIGSKILIASDLIEDKRPETIKGIVLNYKKRFWGCFC